MFLIVEERIAELETRLQNVSGTLQALREHSLSHQRRIGDAEIELATLKERTRREWKVEPAIPGEQTQHDREGLLKFTPILALLLTFVGAAVTVATEWKLHH